MTCVLLNGATIAELALDGPALRVRVKNKCSQWFPLRRLVRVHVIGQLTEGLPVLLALAEQQIPVAFFTAKGQLRAQLYFPVEQTQVGHNLEQLLYDETLRCWFDQWLDNQWRHLLSQWGVAGPLNQRKRLQEKLNHLCKAYMGKRVFHQTQAWLNGMLNASLSQWLVTFGLPIHSSQHGFVRQWLEPMLAMALLVAWVQQLSILPKDNGNVRWIMTFFNRQETHLQQMIKRLLIQLEMALMERI